MNRLFIYCLPILLCCFACHSQQELFDAFCVPELNDSLKVFVERNIGNDTQIIVYSGRLSDETYRFGHDLDDFRVSFEAMNYPIDLGEEFNELLIPKLVYRRVASYTFQNRPVLFYVFNDGEKILKQGIQRDKKMEREFAADSKKEGLCTVRIKVSDSFRISRGNGKPIRIEERNDNRETPALTIFKGGGMHLIINWSGSFEMVDDSDDYLNWFGSWKSSPDGIILQHEGLRINHSKFGASFWSSDTVEVRTPLMDIELKSIDDSTLVSDDYVFKKVFESLRVP